MATGMECVKEPAETHELADAQAGDPGAFCRLIRPHEKRLYRQALALCRDEDAAEDLVQQTLVEAWKSIGRYDRTCRLSTWLCAILLHRHHKMLRAARRWPIPWAKLLPWQQSDLLDASQSLASRDLSPDQALQQSERAAQARAALDSLPGKHRQVIWLRYFEDASLLEMAAALGCSVGTVKSRLHHALEKLRKMNWR